jgi:hypothetical protein
MFWNYPPGEKNLSASFLNVPRSLRHVLDGMQARRLRHRPRRPRPELIAQLQHLLAPAYRAAACSPCCKPAWPSCCRVADYRAWLGSCPPPRRPRCASAGATRAQSRMVVRRGGQAFFVIPRLHAGQGAHPAAAAALRRAGGSPRKKPSTTPPAPALALLPGHLPVGAQRRPATRWCTSAPTARRNGCRARSAACPCRPRHAGAGRPARGLPLHCRQHRRGHSRPSAGAAPPSSATRRRPLPPPGCTRR